MRTEPLVGAAATVPFVRTAPRLAEARCAAVRKRPRQDVVAPEAIDGIPDANDPAVEAAIAAAHEAREACSMPPRPMKGFETGQARQDAWVHAAAERLAEVLPAWYRFDLAGGEQALAQLGPDPHRQAVRMAGAVLRSRAGLSGQRLFDLIKVVAFIEGYGLAMGVDPWPVSAGLAWLLTEGVHRQATRMARGSRGGATVGDRFRETLIFGASLRLPIDADRLVLGSAAPKPPTGGYSDGQAATIPVKHRCQIEEVARGLGDSPQRFWARSWLLAGLDVSLRVADGVRVKLSVDPDDPTVVVADAVIPTSRSKDGMPIRAYAKAEGLLGPYDWAVAHVRQAASLGQVFPAWDGPWGAQRSFGLATCLRREVVDPRKVLRVYTALVGMPPLSATQAEVDEVGVRGHSAHGTPSDWAQTIGAWPSFEFELEERDRPGFGRDEVNALGNWLRLRGGAHDERPPDGAQCAAATGRGRPVGAPNRRAEQAGRYVRGDGREGDRAVQLRLRARLRRIVRAIIAHRCGSVAAWESLPDGRASTALLAGVV